MKKRKKRNKMKKVFLKIALLIITIIILGTIYFFLKPGHNNDFSNIRYSSEAISVMKEKKVYEKINNHEYSKTVEKLLEKNEFKENYLDSYLEITYLEKNNFEIRVNSFLDKKYTSLEINNIFEYLNETNISKLLNTSYIELGDYLKVSNMEVDKVTRYNEYKNEKKLDINTTVTQVNIGLDLDFYETIETIKNPNSVTLLINKYRALPDDYEPTDLVSLSTSSSYKMRKEAAESFEKMKSAAFLDNVTIIPYSPYRGKDRQVILYNNYVARDGKKAADTYSARPRHSEHETGLTVDVRSKNLTDNLTQSDYLWVQKNAHFYGYIVRYPENTTEITGYMTEPWHLRYVGIETSTGINEKKITFDEYYDLFLKEKEES